MVKFFVVLRWLLLAGLDQSAVLQSSYLIRLYIWLLLIWHPKHLASGCLAPDIQHQNTFGTCILGPLGCLASGTFGPLGCLAPRRFGPQGCLAPGILGTSGCLAPGMFGPQGCLAPRMFGTQDIWHPSATWSLCFITLQNFLNHDKITILQSLSLHLCLLCCLCLPAYHIL